MTKTVTRDKPKFDGYQAITDTLIAALEAGTKPWSPRWAGAAFDPRRANGERYKGINILLLARAAQLHGFTSNIWLTYNQATELGATLKPKAARTMIVFYKPVTIGKRDGDASDDESDARTIPMLRVYNVFNADQFDGLPERFTTPPVAANPDQRQQEAERRLRATGATIIEAASASAFYSPARDSITMPHFAAFNSADDFTATLAHELVHWTGAKHRLDRDFSTARASYAFEELVAEIGAAFVCNRLGVAGEHIDDHAAYLASWLKALKDDKRAIFRAAALAQKAADFILDGTESDAPPPSGDGPATRAAKVRSAAHERAIRTAWAMRARARAMAASASAAAATIATPAAPKGAAARPAKGLASLPPEVQAYYEGGTRVIIGGVPCRVAGKPGPSARRWHQQQGAEWRKAIGPCGSDGKTDIAVFALTSLAD